MSRRAIGAALIAAAAVVIAQSLAHLHVVLDRDEIGTVLDLNRSNGLPDLVSTAVFATAAVGGARLAWRDRRASTTALATVLAALVVADALHEGAHPGSGSGAAVIVLSALLALLLAVVALHLAALSRTLGLVGLGLLAASFLVNGLDRYDQWFERRRGDPVAEYQIVGKEGLELVGLSLVALALWNAALREPPRHPP